MEINPGNSAILDRCSSVRLGKACKVDNSVSRVECSVCFVEIRSGSAVNQGLSQISKHSWQVQGMN